MTHEVHDNENRTGPTRMGRPRGRPAKMLGGRPPSVRLIRAAAEAFARSGYAGARIEQIAQKARINQQLIYHYFGSKAGLYNAVLTDLYRQLRGDENRLDIILKAPTAEDSLRELAEFMFVRNPSILLLQRLLQDLNNEQNRRHLRDLDRVRDEFSRLVECLEIIFERGVRAGEFRPGIDVKQFYISMVAIYTVRVNNAATLSFMLDVDLLSSEGAASSREIALSMLLNGIRPTGKKPR